MGAAFIIYNMYAKYVGFPLYALGIFPFNLGKTSLAIKFFAVILLPENKKQNVKPSRMAHKNFKNMKKSMIISSMVVVMSMICTTSFGKVVKHQPIVHSPRTEVIVVKYDHGHCHEVRPHHHDFNRHNECKVCHMTKHQIKKMEKDMQKHHSQPVTWRNTVQQPVRR